jgi:hypothetical protein
MSTSRFNYSFYQDGREDLLAEVRLLQSCGQWTKEKRKSVLKDAISTYYRLKHTHPRVPETCAYYAGRIMALKSALTMKFSQRVQKSKETANLIVYRPLSPHADCFCDLYGCWNKALWGVSRPGDAQLFTLLCNECRQERERCQSAYTTPSGWDWHDDEHLLLPHPVPLPLPVPRDRRLVQMEEQAIELAPVVLPWSFFLGFNLSNLFWPASHHTGLTEILIVGLVAWQGKNIARLLFHLVEEENKRS